MMDPFNKQDYIDAYLKGNLTQEEIHAFEKKMDEDPLLKNEVSYHEDMVHALSKKRKMMLKARLDNVQVGTLANFGAQKIMGWVASVGSILLISGGIWYFQDSSDSGLPSKFAINQNDALVTSQESALPPVPEPEIPDQNQPAGNQANNQNPGSAINKAESGMQSYGETRETQPEVQSPNPESKTEINPEGNSENNADGVAKAQLPEVQQPDVITRFEEDFLNQDTENIEVPQRDLFSHKSIGNNNLQIATIDKEGYDFHYQYYNDRLFLYGDFKETPYEILALNNEDEEELRLFLAYEGEYYAIQHGQEEIAPLINIKDPQLIEELEVVKNHK